MSTWTVSFFPKNELEDGTVTVTGTADTGYPESRIYDLQRSLYWKVTATQATVFHLDAGAAVTIAFLAVDGHNFSGEDYDWQYSSDGITWAPSITSGTFSDNGLFYYHTGGMTYQYWRLSVTSMDNPRCGEVWMSKGYDFKCLMAGPPTGGPVPNTRWARTVGGQERSTKHGDQRRRRTYTSYMSASEFTNFETVLSEIDNFSKPFYFKDHEDNYFLARFDGPPAYDFNDVNYTLVIFSIIEML